MSVTNQRCYGIFYLLNCLKFKITTKDTCQIKYSIYSTTTKYISATDAINGNLNFVL